MSTLDKFHWAKMIARRDIQRLYQSDARGMLDEELLQEKMLSIDWLIHEFHINQGIPGRPVGENVIQGSKEQVSELISSLASGPGSTPGITALEDWQELYNNPVRQFSQQHSWEEIRKTAAGLGIPVGQMTNKHRVVSEILRRNPKLVDRKEENEP